MNANSAHPISMLMFATLGIVLIVVAGVLIYHLRKRGNRHPMEGKHERNIGEMQRDGGDRPRP